MSGRLRVLGVLIALAVIGVLIGMAVKGRKRAEPTTPSGEVAPARTRTVSSASWVRPVRSARVDVPAVEARSQDPEESSWVAEETFGTGLSFTAEPRDPVFAPILEQRIRAILDRVIRELELDDVVRGVQIECKTLSCETVLEVDRAYAAQVYELTSGILLGDSQRPGLAHVDAARSHVTLYTQYRADVREDGYHEMFLDLAVWPVLEALKQQADRGPR